MNRVLRRTRSVCPVCLRRIDAQIAVLQSAEEQSCGQYGAQTDGEKPEAGSLIVMEKTCPQHGTFSVPVWRNRISLADWTRQVKWMSPQEWARCSGDCRQCEAHPQGTCCALLEVTNRCNLHCRFCFADGGASQESDPSIEELKRSIRDISQKGNGPLIQFSGGEPTMRDDLWQLVFYAKQQGCAYVQINTNGIRLAQDEAYAARLAEAGCDIIFLQFDGVTESVYRTLRGADLFEIKKRAIEVCHRLHMGVVLVPTIVRGVNEDQIGEIISFGLAHRPAVTGIHFQPVSYFGRIPNRPENDMRFTLDELIGEITHQSGIPLSAFGPSRCDHPLCGFHVQLIRRADGTFQPAAAAFPAGTGQVSCTNAKQNREYVARHWMAVEENTTGAEAGGFDAFIRKLRSERFSLTAMAFQDAENLDLERVHRCSLHVYEKGRLIPFCAKYLTAAESKN